MPLTNSEASDAAVLPNFTHGFFPKRMDARTFSAKSLARLHQLARYASRVQCRAPDFMIIGAQKGGTTSLYSYLTQHPDVYPAIRKEVHFFENPHNRARGDRWYRSFFPTDPFLSMQERRRGNAVLTGEATPYMAFSQIPGMVHAISPQVRLIFLLRNPVDRAFSHYMHVRRSYPGAELHDFGDAIRMEGPRLQADIDALERDPWHDDVAFRLFSYVQHGMYAEHLKNWMAFFPRDHIYVAESERFFQTPNEILREVCDFLRVPQHAFDSPAQQNLGGYNDEISREDRDFLVRAFTADRTELQRLLGEDFGANWF